VTDVLGQDVTWLAEFSSTARSAARGSGSRSSGGLEQAGHRVETFDMPGSGEDVTPEEQVTFDAFDPPRARSRGRS
jgi:hypothetical protein